MRLAVLLEQLFPTAVAVEAATEADADEGLLPPEEARLLGPMAPIRRREFTLGRNAARRALTRLGLGPVAIPRHDGERDPVWPATIVGSISHSHGIAAAACARAGELLGLGLDVEQAGPLGADIVRTVCRDDDLEMLWDAPAPAPSDWPRLVFAMKEAGYKAWFPLTRAPLEFHAMHLRVDARARRFTATVHHAAASQLPAPWVLEGRFGWNGEVVVAGAVLRRAG